MVAGDVAALVEEAERALAAGDVESAADTLMRVASELPSNQDRPLVLGRSLWLAALISLSRGRYDDFTARAEAAIDSLTRAGDGAGADHARGLYDEITRRVDADLAVERHGALGLLAVLESQLERAIARAEAGGPWDEVDRDRAQLAHLLRGAAEAEPQPLAALMSRFGLDQVAAVAVSLLVPLATSERLRRRALALIGDDGAAPGVPPGLVSGLAFAHGAAQRELVQRLAPASPLRRARVVIEVAAGPPELERVTIDPSVLWFVHGADATELPPIPGVTVARPAAGSIPVDPALAVPSARVARWCAAGSRSLLVLVGRRGAGKSTLLGAGAAAAGRAVMVVDADAVSWEAWDHTIAAVARDGVMTGAIVYLRCDRDLPPLHAIAGQTNLSLSVGVDPGDHEPLVAALRGVRADLVVQPVAAVPEHEQLAAWTRALADCNVTSIRSRSLGPLIRPGLVIGDLLDAIAEALARAEVRGAELTVPDVVAVLDARAHDELSRYAEPVSAAAAPASAARAIEAAAHALRRAHGEVDPWGVATVATVTVVRGAVAIVGGDEAARLAGAAHIARRLEQPLFRLDLADLVDRGAAEVRAWLRALADAAGRAGALVLLSSGEVLRGLAPGPIPYAVGDVLAAPTTGFVVAADRASSLPSPVRTRLAAQVDLDDADQGAA